MSAAFVINQAQRDQLIGVDPRSADVIRPFASGKEIHRWSVEAKQKWIIITKIGIDIMKYPAIFAHLSRWKTALQERQDQGDHWWELRPCSYYSTFDQPKIVYQVFQVKSSFAYDEGGTYVNNSAYIIPMKDMYLLGILNSAPFWSEITRQCTRIQNGYQLMRAYVGRCIVPTAFQADRTAIADMVQLCVDAKGQGPQVAEWEAEINARVAKLYGL